jgi:hypothetical protein
MGLSPGPDLGEIFRAVYELQLDGGVGSLDEARAGARKILLDV